MGKNTITNSHQEGRRKSERLGLGSFELAGDSSYSQKKLRMAFFHALDRMAPDVAFTLYEKAFFQFLRLAWSKFPQTVPPPVSKYLDDGNLLVELERIVKDFSALPYNAESESIHPAFVELLILPFKQELERFINKPRGVLMRELLRPLRQLSEESEESLHDAFTNWATLLESAGAGPLRETLVEWSRQWNLDADWCRDFAVATLREWLTDEWLQWQQQGDGWRLAFSKALTTIYIDDLWSAPISDVSAVGVNAANSKLLSLLTQSFKFTWKGLDFQYDRWNPLARYKDDWGRECDERFRTYLMRHDKQGGTVPTGALGKFQAAKDKYVREIEQAAGQAGLVKTPKRWASDEHLMWAVRFQIQKWSLSKIEETYSKPRKTISDGINRTLGFIGLPRRPDLPAGMPKGKRLTARRRIVRN